jgi:hypothetical protein
MAKRKAVQAAETKVAKANGAAAKRTKGASEPLMASGFKNKEKVLVVSSRGITFR